MEQTLFICKEVDLYRLPPRGSAVGWRSGEWRVDDKIFTARCRVVAVGDTLEVRLEDPAKCVWVLIRSLFFCFGSCPLPCLPSSHHTKTSIAVISSNILLQWRNLWSMPSASRPADHCRGISHRLKPKFCFKT